jgi:hypothetical protein
MRQVNRDTRNAFIATAAVVLVSGCIDPPRYEAIDKLRILAIRSDRPQLTVGETASVDALVATPDDAPVTLRWQLCAYVKSADEKRACPKAAVIQSGEGETFDFTFTESLADALEPFCRPDEALLKKIPDGAALPRCTDRGYPLVIRLTARSGKETRVSVKRVLAARDLGERRFENPAITGFDNLPDAVRPGEIYTFKATVDASAPPSDLRYTWFLRGADVEYMLDTTDRDAPWEVHLKIAPDAARVSAWIVVRDAAYGVDWRRLDFEVE